VRAYFWFQSTFQNSYDTTKRRESVATLQKDFERVVSEVRQRRPSEQVCFDERCPRCGHLQDWMRPSVARSKALKERAGFEEVAPILVMISFPIVAWLLKPSSWSGRAALGYAIASLFIGLVLGFSCESAITDYRTSQQLGRRRSPPVMGTLAFATLQPQLSLAAIQVNHRHTVWTKEYR
jgi:hypothetical protein